ncbi:hypothetical protein [Aliiroseovarius crassostreae]|uniref:hypothetical protein n=1 Tax=Aliiroseovarius crassostreae TaxID=154981 RepID=UPI0022099FDA|nr:hypothetical protein [Aliiroseovarius crassostreae]UWQ04480.1 hypothetical protein K3X22_12560 [Aliiroseovarius crassostreae]
MRKRPRGVTWAELLPRPYALSGDRLGRGLAALGSFLPTPLRAVLGALPPSLRLSLKAFRL